jgi:hypothetical protein
MLEPLDCHILAPDGLVGQVHGRCGALANALVKLKRPNLLDHACTRATAAALGRVPRTPQCRGGRPLARYCRALRSRRCLRQRVPDLDGFEGDRRCCCEHATCSVNPRGAERLRKPHFPFSNYDRDLVACSNKRWTSFGGASNPENDKMRRRGSCEDAPKQLYIYIFISIYWLGGGSTPQLFGVEGTLLVVLVLILVGGEVQSSRIQANSPRAPAGLSRVATPIMPNGHIWSCVT